MNMPNSTFTSISFTISEILGLLQTAPAISAGHIWHIPYPIGGFLGSSNTIHRLNTKVALWSKEAANMRSLICRASNKKARNHHHDDYELKQLIYRVKQVYYFLDEELFFGVSYLFLFSLATLSLILES